MKRELRITIMVSQAKRGYGRLKARVVGSRAGIRPGEVEVPLCITLDDAWFRRRTDVQQVVLPDPPPPAAEVSS